MNRGPGIEPSLLPHVFDRFYRSDAARTGTRAGLGLAIAKELTEAQHGLITVKSRVGQGKRLYPHFPQIAVDLEAEQLFEFIEGNDTPVDDGFTAGIVKRGVNHDNPVRKLPNRLDQF